MTEILERISTCVEYGKVDLKSPYPPAMKDQEGAFELTRHALDAGISPGIILEEALIPAMSRVGQKFSRNEIFVPQMLMAAKAMSSSMIHIKPYYLSGETKRKGTFIIGTVKGDLHDIGKNLVSMMIEGAGWEIIDLGVDVSTEKFIEAADDHPGAVIGLSALLTTTMENMRRSVAELRERFPDLKILIGGAPVTAEFCQKIGADHYSPDPQGAVEYLNQLS
ncbi:MAG: cobalamin-binding protein [Bacteroidales bacterium]|jgi:methanogenic corrinoid protein MtbC1|nr:cobalamin-binding protein [Bacteroidales bacterium]